MRIICLFIFLLLIANNVNADQSDEKLDDLFNILKKSSNLNEINDITLKIWDIWLETNDPLIEKDFQKAIKYMNNGQLYLSINYLTSIIKRKPNFAEAWNKRATIYFILGDYNSSMKDINETLKLEPRHFGAMDGMSLIFINKYVFFFVNIFYFL